MVAGVAEAIEVDVGLVGVGKLGAVVELVHDVVAVEVAVVERVAGAAGAVGVAIELIGVVLDRAVVVAVVEPVAGAGGAPPMTAGPDQTNTWVVSVESSALSG